jgi:hypothetical protein
VDAFRRHTVILETFSKGFGNALTNEPGNTEELLRRASGLPDLTDPDQE